MEEENNTPSSTFHFHFIFDLICDIILLVVLLVLLCHTEIILDSKFFGVYKSDIIVDMNFLMTGSQRGSQSTSKSISTLSGRTRYLPIY